MADTKIAPQAYFREAFVPFADANLSIASAPVLYGLSIYTVIPVFWNKTEQRHYVFRLTDHFKRLQNSAKIMAFDDFLQGWNQSKFDRTVKQLILKNNLEQDCLVRVSVFVDDLLQGTRMRGL